MPFRMECINCVPFLSKIFPKTLPRRPETAQDDPRDDPRESKASPRRSQDTPKTPASCAPGATRRRPWAAPEESGNARKPDRVPEPPGTPKIPPKGPQNAAKMMPNKTRKLPKKNVKMIQESLPEHLPKWSSEASIGPSLKIIPIRTENAFNKKLRHPKKKAIELQVQFTTCSGYSSHGRHFRTLRDELHLVMVHSDEHTRYGFPFDEL